MGSLLALPFASAQAGKPVLRTSPTSFDFGYMPENFMAYKTYWLANDGDDTLHIAEVKPSCGCTAAPLKQKVVAPGDSVPLEVSFNSRRFNGVVNKLVRIHSDDTTNSPAKIYFTARVNETDPNIRLEPTSLSFNEIGENKSEIILTNAGKSEYRPSFSSEPPPYLSVSFAPDVIPPGGTATLTIAVNEKVPIGSYQTSLTLWVEGDIPHPITIPVKGVGYAQ